MQVMARILASTILVLGFLCGSVASAKTLLVLGDSLSAGHGLDAGQSWVSLLEQRIEQRNIAVDVINASISGDTTNGGLSRLPGLLEQHHPQWVLLELGANDGLRGTPLNLIRANLRKLVQLAQQSGAQVVMIGNHIPPNYGPRYANGFFDLFAQVAKEQDLPLVPFLLEGVALNPKLMQSDGLHPTAEAQPRLLETVWDVVGPLLQR